MTPRRIVILLALTLAVAGASALLFLNRTTPEVADLDRAAAAVAGATDMAGSGSDSGAGAAAAEGTGDAETLTDATGTWRVDTEIVAFDGQTGEGTWVGYRIDEELSGIGAYTAVGRTPEVSGTLTIDGTRVMSAVLTARLGTLRSDNGNRDARVRPLFADRDATFELLAPVGFAEVPEEGQRVTAVATGILTIGDVSQELDVELAATVAGGRLVVTGAMTIVLAEFGIVVPSAPVVLSVSDVAVIELQLYLTRD
jgi:hypothetical protein